MLNCINKNSVEFQTLKNRSGLSEFVIESYSRLYLNKYGRFPYLDELPNSNSEPYLKESIKLRKDNSTSLDSIYRYTNTNNVDDATIQINNEHRDLEVSILPLGNDALVNIKHRPNEYDLNEYENQAESNPINSVSFLNNSIYKLSKLYGIKFHNITNSELNSPEWKNKISNVNTINAFIYNGEIYINTDNTSIDAPLHELMHLLLGSIKFTNPDLYYSLTSLSSKFTNYEKLIRTFKNRTNSDINEELFITEFSRYVTGQDSVFQELSEDVLHEISYNVNRLLDSVFMGTYSAKEIDSKKLYAMDMKSLASRLNSAALNNEFYGKLDDAEIHRILQNKKSELLKSGELKEYC